MPHFFQRKSIDIWYRNSLQLVSSRNKWCPDSVQSLKISTISPCKTAKMGQLQRFTVSILSKVTTWIQLTGLRSWLNSSRKVSEPTLTPPMSWRKPMFLTEKTEQNRQLEPFYGNISLVKVVKDDL